MGCAYGIGVLVVLGWLLYMFGPFVTLVLLTIVLVLRKLGVFE
jgi:hypothetical protein